MSASTMNFIRPRVSSTVYARGIAMMSATFSRDTVMFSAWAAPSIGMPGPGRRLGGRLSYHLRDGEHDMLTEDWSHALDAADEALAHR